jgi:hypothetical protein
MTFNPSVPQPPQFLSASQPVFLANNQSLDNVFGKNHFKFSDGTINAGRHKWCELVELQAPLTIPSGLSGGEGTLYVKTSVTGSQLFYTDGTSTNQYQLTNVRSAKFGTFGTLNIGWTFLAAGLIQNYGFVSNNLQGTSGSVTFSRDYTNCFLVIAQPFYTGANPNGTADVAVNSSPTGFSWAAFTNSGAYAGFTWIAIGK